MAVPDQAPDSSQDGFLQGSPPRQITPSQPLENFLQQLVAGVAGLEETLVRPRWQPQPPNLPDKALNWAASGITKWHELGYAAVQHMSEGDGHDEMQRQEAFDLLVTFYGPLCATYASNLIDGFNIWQNRSRLKRIGLNYTGHGDVMRVPELIKNEWIDRCDVTLSWTRMIVRDYPVLNLLDAAFTLNTDGVTKYSHGPHSALKS